MLEEGEIFFLRQIDENHFEGLMMLLKRNRPGTKIILLSHENGPDITVTITALTEQGAIFHIEGTDVLSFLATYGRMPLPPYIADTDEAAARYQTTFAHHDGSVAAPTASLHFTEELLQRLHDAGIEQRYVTLHI